MAKLTVVRFKVDSGLWRAFKGASMIRNRNPFDSIRKYLKKESRRLIGTARTTRKKR